MKSSNRSKSFLWGLLFLSIVAELVCSSRWLYFRFSSLFLARKPPGASTEIPRIFYPRGVSGERVPRVWFAPYVTFPEPGFLESLARSGVYDTLLAFPGAGVATNYGASKLSPADTLFSLAAAYGVGSEYRLARILGFDVFAIDLGALVNPALAAGLCNRSTGCRVTADYYALFPVSGAALRFARDLDPLERRISFLPQRSAGPTWGPLILSPFQWNVAGTMRDSHLSHDDSVLRVDARPLGQWDLYRYPLNAYPPSVQPWLKFAPGDIQLQLAPDVQNLQLCIGSSEESCRKITLGNGSARRLDLGLMLPPGQLSRLQQLTIRRSNPAQPPFVLRLRASVAAQVLTDDRP